ncbi:cytidylyltransferase domain-containing protein [Rosistilla oblonga]|uniref:acylneuraminate cytidylyltransferase family protein n=1 Tax=Rosistilla oblonga TaxID=2527990 RepID=UPI003A9796DA
MNPSIKTLAIIPARSGSKTIKDKNLQLVGGKPLLVRSIEQALEAEHVHRVVVDTDSEHYAAIAREHGAEILYLRPSALATDTSTDLEVFEHAFSWILKNEGALPELVVHLRPTYPFRTPADIDAAIEMLDCHSEWDSLRSVAPAPHTPYKMWSLRKDGSLAPLLDLPAIRDPWNQPRQNLPVAYHQNACIDVVRPTTILEKQSMTGAQIGAFIMNHFHDIDTRVELARVDQLVATQSVPTGKTFVFDIDGVIASITPGNDYNMAMPIVDHIAAINRLYDNGNRIILMTARGFLTGIDWKEVTTRQMSQWGVRYHELRFGKPAADYYIDDRMLPLSALEFWLQAK